MLDASIILAGRPVNVLGAMSGGFALRQQRDEMDRQNALAQMLQQNGNGLMSGDPAAYNALAAFDPQLAQSLRAGNQDYGFAAERQGWAGEQQEWGRQDQALQMSQAEREEALLRTRGIEAALAQGDMDTAARMWREEGLPEEALGNPQAMVATLAQLGSGLETYGALQPDTPTPTDDMREYQVAVEQGYQGTLMDFITESRRAGATNVNVGPNGEPFGNPGAGLVWQRDAQGAIALDERGAPVAIPYQGGPAWQEQQTAQAEAAGAGERAAAAAADEALEADVVLQDIGRLKEIVQGAGMFNPATGFGAGLAAQAGGTNAANAEALIDTIAANIAFDELAQMRAASPTGGALGSITENELKLLSSVLGSMSQAQSRDQFIQNLNRLETIYAGIVEKARAYPNAAEFGFAPEAPPIGDAPAPSTPPDMSDDDLLNFYLQGGQP